MIDPGFKGCRWPLLRAHEAGDIDTRFCCAPAYGRTFCPTHALRAYTTPQTVRGSAQELIRGLRRYTS